MNYTQRHELQPSTSFPPRIKYGVNSSGNPERHWIPPYQVRGRLSQARKYTLYKTYVVMHSFCNAPLYKSSNFPLIKIYQNTPQPCWGDEWFPLSPGGRGLG
jgi:hypothetical protein